MAVLSSDALSSVAYATDQTLAVFILGGSAALSWSLPVGFGLVKSVPRAFSSGCSAMTGIEVIANGVQVCRDPAATGARATMAVMGLILSLMFLRISHAGMDVWRGSFLQSDHDGDFGRADLWCLQPALPRSPAVHLLLIPSLVWILALIKKRYGRLQHALELDESDVVIEPVLPPHSEVSIAPAEPGQGPIVVFLEAFGCAAIAAVRQACSMSRQVSELSVYSSHPNQQQIRAQWDRQIGQPLGVALTLKESPYASFIDPLVEMVHVIESTVIDGIQLDQRLTVLMASGISTGWLDGLLLNQSVDLVSAALRDPGSRLFSRYRYYLQV